MLSRPPVTSLPAEAVVFFPDGNMLCAVHGDFENLQESPAGFGEGVLEALDSLRQDLLKEREAIDRRLGQAGTLIDSIYRSQGMSEFNIGLKRNSRHIETWPVWKRNTNWLDNRASNPTPRPHVDNTGDDGGY